MSKAIHIGTITSEQIRKMQKSRQEKITGCGVHGDTKYNRRRKKQEDKRIIEEG